MHQESGGYGVFVSMQIFRACSALPENLPGFGDGGKLGVGIKINKYIYNLLGEFKNILLQGLKALL